MKISIICPFYNEESILKNALSEIIKNLNNLKYSWEFIIINDGSTDGSLDIVKEFLEKEKRLKLLSYEVNKGRGYALRTGIESSIGDFVITTEIDLSWGDNIIHELIEKFNSHKGIDCIVASPNLKKGGYLNVPLMRVLVSKIGNQIIRLLFTKEITMNTGMTRGYSGKIIRNIILTENGKEFHLEVLLKLKLLGFKIDEIPAVLEWKDNKLNNSKKSKRKSKSKMNKLILTHMNFAIFANPIRYFMFFSMFSLLCSIIILGLLLLQQIDNKYLYESIISAFLFLFFAINFFGFGILSTQNISLLKENWLKNK